MLLGLTLRTADDIIGIPRAALRTSQPSGPADHGNCLAILSGQLGRVGLKAMLASLAPHNEANMSRRGLGLSEKRHLKSAIPSVAL